MFDRLGSTVLFGLAANTDNLTIGIAYGMKLRRISFMQNLFIAVVTTLVTLTVMAVGRQSRNVLPAGITDPLGAALLLTFAAWNIYQDRNVTTHRPSIAARLSSQQAVVGLRECLFLAAVLSINNTGLAVAGGLGGIHYVSALWSILAFSVVMLALGQVIGSSLTHAGSVPKVLRSPMSGNAILALTGLLMLTGY